MRFLIPTLFAFAFTTMGDGPDEWAEITSVDAKKGIIIYKSVLPVSNKDEIQVKVAPGFSVHKGYARPGKPGIVKLGEEIPGGLASRVFEKVSPKNPLMVNLYFAIEADKEKAINKGDVIKILVNPRNK